MIKIWCRLAVLAVACGCMFSSAQGATIAPYYPQAKPITYSARIIPKDQLSSKINGIASFSLANYEKIVSLDGDWKILPPVNSQEPFAINVDLDKSYAGTNYDDKAWDSIKVPLNWYEQYPQARQYEAPYVKAWYRKTITIPASGNGKNVLIHFGVVGYQADLFINGQLASSHHGDFIPWDADITKWIKFGKSNTIALRVFSDFGPSFGVKTAKHAYGDQWGIGDIKAGIWQSAWLTYVPKIYVKRALISPDITTSKVTVEYCIANVTGKTQYMSLQGIVQSAVMISKDQPANINLGKIKLLPGENLGKVQIKLKNPVLWSPENPHLYYLVLALRDGKKMVSAHAERFGYRSFKAKGPNFYLNGKRIYLFGENIPSIWYGGSKRSAKDESAHIRNSLLGFKSRGYNIIRTAHQPIVPEVLDVADEIGLLIYDEWAWAFSNTLDKSFEKTNLQELKQWVYRDYNHASVVMWSCGNEVNYDGNKPVYEQLNKQVPLVRSLDATGRPVSSFSGSAFFFGKWKLNTDLVDYHTYLGLLAPAWTHWEEDVNRVINYDSSIYAEKGKFDKPFIVWECIGFSWGQYEDPSFTIGDVDAYAAYANKASSWGAPNGVGFAGTIGMAAALNPGLGCPYGQEVYGKRIMEIIRYNDRVQGAAPWFINPNLNAATIWNQPTYCGLREANGVPPTSFFTGRVYKPMLFIMNSRNENWKNLDLNVTLVSSDGKQQQIGSFKVAKVIAWEKYKKNISMQLPNGLVPGNYQLRLTLMNGKSEVSRNFYNIFVQNPSVATSTVLSTKKIGVLKQDDEPGKRILKVFSDLGITAAQISDLNSLGRYDVIVVPPATSRNPLLSTQEKRNTLMQWVSNGGLLLSLEQNYGDKVWLGSSLQSGENTFVDVVIPKHPIFNGLTAENFDTWSSNPSYGHVINYGLAPFTVNALAARGPFCGSRGVLNATAEGSYGNGRIIASQLNAAELWNVDSVATTYLYNLFSYAFGNNLVPNVRPWSANRRDIEMSKDQVKLINLRPYANKGFSDEVSGDQKGGWTDQGDNDFRMIPLGERMVNGVPFEIIDPAKNGGKSCLILKGPFRTYFPGKINGIRVDANLQQLFFLHALAWGGGDGRQVGEYRVNYDDGTFEIVALKDGINVADWYNPGDLKEALVGITAKHRSGADVGLWVLAWDNPNPSKRIISIDFSSDGNSAMPILVAVTGRK
ncbi:MAG: glycoside hydrolase family 2 TIM barrel-domain containing protein [Armatimonadota bacterium]|nr:hypothetical protein [bacterium]